MTPVPSSDPASRSDHVWALVVVGLALAVFFAGGGPVNFRPPVPPPTFEGASLPEALEPQGTDFPSPPSTFRWRPGGDDVNISHVNVLDSGFQVIWASPPLKAGVTEVQVPSSAFDGLAGQQCFWRVREVSDGKPRASSAVSPFAFRRDGRGYGPGEAPSSEFLD